jgi:hypothetical protein
MGGPRTGRGAKPFLPATFTQKKGASQDGPRLLIQRRDLLLAPITGSTTLGGVAARCGRCLRRSCKPKCDYRQEQNCRKLFHGFSPLKIKLVFRRPMGMPSALESSQTSKMISKCEAGGFRGVCLCRCAKRTEQLLVNGKSEPSPS